MYAALLTLVIPAETAFAHFNYKISTVYVEPSILLVAMVIAYAAVTYKHKLEAPASAIAPELGSGPLEQNKDQKHGSSSLSLSSAAASSEITTVTDTWMVPPPSNPKDHKDVTPTLTPKSKKRAGQRGSSLFIITAITLL